MWAGLCGCAGPQATVESAQSPVLGSAIVFVFGLLLEAMVAFGNWTFATTHTSEFGGDMHWCQSCFLMGVLKLSAQLSQLILTIQTIMGMYIFYVYFSVAEPACVRSHRHRMAGRRACAHVLL